MKNEQNVHDDRIASISDGALQIDLSGMRSRQLMVLVTEREPSPLDSGHFSFELDAGRIHRLGLAENPPSGEYTVVILDPEKPERPPRVSHIQIREVRG